MKHAGVFCQQLAMTYCYKLDRKCSVYQEEIVAIMKMTEFIKTMKNEITEPVIINVDSQAAL